MLYTLYYLMRTDFLERVRRYSFLVTLGCILIVAYLYAPAQGSAYHTLSIGPARGIYNSAWLGLQVAVISTIFLGLVGFFLVKNTLERDEQTGVAQIIAATPLRHFLYTLGKMLSNFAVLVILVAATIIVTVLLQFIRAEDLHLDLWALISPFVFITLPVMALVAALAVVFETIPWLRRGFGNILYFFLYIILSGLSTLVNSSGQVDTRTIFEPFGIAYPLSRVVTSTLLDPLSDHSITVGIVANAASTHLQHFVWTGLQWPLMVILARVGWLLLACALAALSGTWFNGFDPARAHRRKNLRSIQAQQALQEQMPEEDAVALPATPPILTPLSSLRDRSQGNRWGGLFVGELRLFLKGLRWWWYTVAVALIIAEIVVPLPIARTIIYPIAWIWPLLAWSSLGNREARYHTQQIIFSAPHPLMRQLPVQWSMGFLLALITASGIAFNFLLVGDGAAFLSLLIGAFFIASLAITAGIWSRSSKLFELLYLSLWYIGAVNQLPYLDYMGVTVSSVNLHISFYFLVCTVILLLLAFVGRRQQLVV